MAQVGGYGRVDLHTSYDVTENFQVYGLINNLFDRHYGLFGNLFDTEEATEAGEPSGYVITSPLRPGAGSAVCGLRRREGDFLRPRGGTRVRTLSRLRCA